MSILAKHAPLINDEFLEELDKAFTRPSYNPETKIEEIMYEEGKRYVVEWIKQKVAK